MVARDDAPTGPAVYDFRLRIMRVLSQKRWYLLKRPGLAWLAVDLLDECVHEERQTRRRLLSHRSNCNIALAAGAVKARGTVERRSTPVVRPSG
jgi:hypothetical protein